MSEYITVVNSPKGPVNFSTQFNTTIDLDDGFEVALTDLYHGAISNVTAENNHFYLLYTGHSGSGLRALSLDRSLRFTIPTGYYNTSFEVLDAMRRAIGVLDRKSLDSMKYSWFQRTGFEIIPELEYTWSKKGVISTVNCNAWNNSLEICSNDGTGKIIEITLKINEKHSYIKFYQPVDEVTLLTLLDQPALPRTTLTTSVIDLPKTNDVGFIFASLVGSSRMNNKNTNLLAVVPLRGCASKFTHHSVKNLTYRPLSVTKFDKIHFEVQNIVQKPIHIEHRSSDVDDDPDVCPIIMILHIRKRL